MQGSRVTVAQEASQFLPFGVLTFHGRFKQGLLNIARHVAPNIHSRPSQQAREAFQSVSHWPSEIAVVNKGTAYAHRRSIANHFKRRLEWDFLPKTSKPWRICCFTAF